jgi:sec-independent protein translocase protein TatA
MRFVGTVLLPAAPRQPARSSPARRLRPDHRRSGRLVDSRRWLMFGSFGLPELLIILVIIVVLFGVNKLPKLGKGLGEGIRNFKNSVKTGEEDEEESKD